jgi:3alpha(or 20beta)-hydroxysteroid dehydrogenase
MGALDGKVAIVTGAGRGIGREEALFLASEGAKVVVNDVGASLQGEGGDESPAHEVAGLITQQGGTASVNGDDVSSWEGAKALVDQAVATYGQLNILVNNAGIIRVTPLVDCDLESFRKVIDTNLIGAFLGMRAVIRPMQAGGGGSIINFSSPQGLEGRYGMPAYTASKFAVRGLTKTAAIELGPLGIRVNTVVPGPTRTAMTERKGWTDADYDAAYGLYPLGRMADPAELAAVCVFLASDDASFCTGGDFVADGGITAGKPRDPA